MKKHLLALALLFNIANVQAAENTDMVVATVNQQAITLQELKDRITLTKMLVNRQLSNAEFEMLKQQSIEQLVNEELKRQYAKEKKIAISSKELKAALKTIEKQRGLAEGDLLKKMPENLKTTALNQIKDSILQQKIVQKVIIPRVYVADYEVNNLLDNVLRQAQTKEYKISQIKINYSDNQNKDLQKINRIHQQLIAGEKFENLVAAYSQDDNKLNGGVLGWFTLNELNTKLKREVEKLAKGEFSKPVKSNDGLFILKVDDIKVTKNIDTSEKTQYKFILFTSSDKLSVKKREQIENQLKTINGYSDFEQMKQTLSQKDGFIVHDNLDWVNLEDIPEKHQMKILDTLPSNFSEMVVGPDGKTRFIYLMDVRVKKSDQVERIKDRIKLNLQTSKAERKFRKFAKDLRAKAFVEIRY
jgi:peptidyl-prolyl cis-trans isomerase SurA